MMQAFRTLNGLVAPLDRANVDTDAIIPKQFLKSIDRSGFGANLFDAWGVAYFPIEGPDDRAAIRQAYQHSLEHSGPAVVLIGAPTA